MKENKSENTAEQAIFLKSYLSELCFILGLNTAHDYDGVNNDSDILIYSKAIKRKIEEIKSITLKKKEKHMSIAQEVHSIMYERAEEKERQYGPFIESMVNAAEIAQTLTGKNVSAEDMCLFMTSLKLSRLRFSYKRDSLVDAIAYLSGLDIIKNS